MTKGSSKLKIIFLSIISLAFVGLAGTSVLLYLDNRDLKDQVNLTSEEKNKRLVEEVNKVYDLPDEDPVVAIVTDPEEFKSQYPTFDNAEAGDYLLFFRKARLNVLYRQSEKKVVKTATVVVPVAVELIGSESALADAEKKLADFGNQITLKKTINNDITQSFIYDLNNDQQNETQSIADLLKLDVGATLPSNLNLLADTEVVIVIADTPVEPKTDN